MGALLKSTAEGLTRLRWAANLGQVTHTPVFVSPDDLGALLDDFETLTQPAGDPGDVTVVDWSAWFHAEP